MPLVVIEVTGGGMERFTLSDEKLAWEGWEVRKDCEGKPFNLAAHKCLSDSG